MMNAKQHRVAVVLISLSHRFPMSYAPVLFALADSHLLCRMYLCKTA